MPDRPQDRKSKLISEEAADWLAYLKQDNLRASERQQYVRWLKQSPAHIAEMLRLSTLDGLLRNTNLDGIPPSQDEAGGQEASNVIDSDFDHIAPAEIPPEIVQRPVSIARQSGWHARVNQDDKGSLGVWIMLLLIDAGKR